MSMSESNNPNALLYSEASFLVCNVLGKKCRLKSALYENDFTTDLRKLYALACKTLDSFSLLHETVKQSKLVHRHPVEHIPTKSIEGRGSSSESRLTGCRHCLLYVTLHDLLLGSSRSNYKIWAKELYLVTQETGAISRFRRAYKVVKKARKKENEHTACIRPGNQNDTRLSLPCYARVNRLRADLESVLKELQSEQYTELQTPGKRTRKMLRKLEDNQFYVDYHLSDNLLIFAHGSLLYKLPAVTSRKLIIQDKASCIVPEVVRPNPNADVLDACAAPGNKTLQLIEMMSPQATVFAIDRDPTRFRTLCNNLHSSGVQRLSISGSIIVDNLPDPENATTTKRPCSQPRVEAICQDFLSLDPMDSKFSRVESILLDPSCSGSGLVARQPEGTGSVLSSGYSNMGEDDMKGEDISRRLERLSNLQAQLLRHALSFQNVRRVVYSTCSVRSEENEAVVLENLERFRGWSNLTVSPPSCFLREQDNVSTDVLMSETTGIGEAPDSSCSSRRQVKRLESYIRRKETRRELRKAYKNRRKAKRALWDHLQTEKLNSEGSSDTPRSRKALSHAPRMSESPCSTKIVIDCAHDHLMSFKDICKLANQITNCYAFNRRLVTPVQLYVTGLKADGQAGDPPTVRLRDRLALAGSEHWDIHLCDEDYWEMFDAQSIVYLCAESPMLLPDQFLNTPPPTTMEELAKPISSEDVFVIGGLVDHNHLLGHCYEEAVKRGYRTARLPIAESGMVLNGRKVLSTLQVFEALAPVVAGSMTWFESLNAAIPPRKKLRSPD
ncbi:putative 28S rRNA (cytosine-C(5))-methyltransferase [Clonorchis sinensis]|uniref:28S rRNA (Cytosine-C(5))-methyltransferase n=1 Tax=Clonorchis sinensis TaxID=79923 RepID=A0A8T1LY63_CLOSI|nr:putative 28S rRNA (cytosine-C(5))-methyltransferase [Clonorchis sinensis]